MVPPSRWKLQQRYKLLIQWQLETPSRFAWHADYIVKAQRTQALDWHMRMINNRCSAFICTLLLNNYYRPVRQASLPFYSWDNWDAEELLCKDSHVTESMRINDHSCERKGRQWLRSWRTFQDNLKNEISCPFCEQNEYNFPLCFGCCVASSPQHPLLVPLSSISDKERPTTHSDTFQFWFANEQMRNEWFWRSQLYK